MIPVNASKRFPPVTITKIRSANGELLSVSNTDLTKTIIHNFEMAEKRRQVSIIGVEYETSVEMLHKIPDILEQAVKSVPEAEFARVHFSAFIYTEFSKFDNEMYLEISREKCRYKRTPTDYFVTKLNDGFFIDDDYGTDFSTCRPSIMPSESFGEVSEVGGRGASNLLRGNHPISKAEQEELDKKKKDDECKPIFEANSDGVSEEGVSPEEYIYDMIMWKKYLIFSAYQRQVFQGFTPFYMHEEGSLHTGTDGTEYTGICKRSGK